MISIAVLHQLEPIATLSQGREAVFSKNGKLPQSLQGARSYKRTSERSTGPGTARCFPTIEPRGVMQTCNVGAVSAFPEDELIVEESQDMQDTQDTLLNAKLEGELTKTPDRGRHLNQVHESEYARWVEKLRNTGRQKVLRRVTTPCG